MKTKLFLTMLFVFTLFLFRVDVKASTYEKSENFLKILTKDELLVTSEYTYNESSKTYIKLDLLFENEVLPFKNISDLDFLTRKKIKKINSQDYLDSDSIKTIFKMNYTYDKDANTLYYGEEIKTDDLLAQLLEKTDYTTEDFIWLSKIIYAEGRGENYSSKLAVGNVIINRVESKSYPNTIYDVIFDNKFGVQFSPILDGSINNNSNLDCKIVAIDVLLNINNCGDALFFMNPKIAETSWISENREHLVTYGNHDFYA